MRIGTTSMVFWHADLATAVTQVAELGFDAIEIWVSHLEKADGISSGKLARLLREAGLACTIHAPFKDINIASVNKGIRRESTAQMIAAVDLCAELGGELVVIHPGKLSSKKSDPDEQWKYQVDSFHQILEAAKARGVTATVENMEWDKEGELVRMAEDIGRLQRMLPDFRLPVTLDTAHMADTGRIIEAIELFGSDIVHVHVSDFGPPRHIPLGEGTLDFAAIIKKLHEVGFAGILSLEVFIPGSAERLAAEREKLVRLLADL